MAFLEYFHVKIQHLKPSFPFGKWISETGFSYDKSMLYIGIAALIFAVLAYISLLIKSFIRIVIVLFMYLIRIQIPMHACNQSIDLKLIS